MFRRISRQITQDDFDERALSDRQAREIVIGGWNVKGGIRPGVETAVGGDRCLWACNFGESTKNSFLMSTGRVGEFVQWELLFGFCLRLEFSTFSLLSYNTLPQSTQFVVGHCEA